MEQSFSMSKNKNTLHDFNFLLKMKDYINKDDFKEISMMHNIKSSFKRDFDIKGLYLEKKIKTIVKQRKSDNVKKSNSILPKNIFKVSSDNLVNNQFKGENKYRKPNLKSKKNLINNDIVNNNNCHKKVVRFLNNNYREDYDDLFTGNIQNFQKEATFIFKSHNRKGKKNLNFPVSKNNNIDDKIKSSIQLDENKNALKNPIFVNTDYKYDYYRDNY